VGSIRLGGSEKNEFLEPTSIILIDFFGGWWRNKFKNNTIN
jgi:hypothetical protein